MADDFYELCLNRGEFNYVMSTCILCPILTHETRKNYNCRHLTGHTSTCACVDLHEP